MAPVETTWGLLLLLVPVLNGVGVDVDAESALDDTTSIVAEPRSRVGVAIPTVIGSVGVPIVFPPLGNSPLLLMLNRGL